MEYRCGIEKEIMVYSKSKSKSKSKIIGGKYDTYTDR